MFFSNQEKEKPKVHQKIQNYPFIHMGNRNEFIITRGVKPSHILGPLARQTFGASTRRNFSSSTYRSTNVVQPMPNVMHPFSASMYSKMAPMHSPFSISKAAPLNPFSASMYQQFPMAPVQPFSESMYPPTSFVPMQQLNPFSVSMFGAFPPAQPNYSARFDRH